MTMRLPETERAYKAAKLPGLLNEVPLRDWKYWCLIDNAFTHDRISEVNHLLVLKRRATLTEVKPLEWVELLKAIVAIRKDYSCVMLNFPGMSSVPDIPHFHLYRLKRLYRE